jgi:hypothetical protein
MMAVNVNTPKKKFWRHSISGILRDYTPNNALCVDDIVRAAWRHVEIGGNDQSVQFRSVRKLKVTILDGPKVAKFLVG